jgi:hypothetical protein
MNMNAKVIIVVEDKEIERAAAITAIRTSFIIEEEGLCIDLGEHGSTVAYKTVGLMVMLAHNLSVVDIQLSIFTYRGVETSGVGVITDLMFPAVAGGKEELNGLRVVTDCVRNGFPVVICSDTDHHDIHYLNNLFPILGKVHPKGEIPTILDKKDWNKAVTELRRLCCY